jgi:hypothetical protein
VTPLQLAPVPAPPTEEPDPVVEETVARLSGLAGFAPGVAAKLRSYVYLLVDPRTGAVLYAGRGRGDHCFRHLTAARSGADRSVPAIDRILAAESAGGQVRVDILRYGMSPSEASTVEAAVRDALGLSEPCKAGRQRETAPDLNVVLAKRAKFKREHRVVLLTVGGPGADPSYDAARHGWRIALRWTDPAAPRSPQWAVLVVADLVAAVYRIDRWEPHRSLSAPTAPPDPGPGDRYCFVGERDADMEERYRGRSVAAYRVGSHPAPPLTYVGCGRDGQPAPA